jgi:hypothetical protein
MNITNKPGIDHIAPAKWSPHKPGESLKDYAARFPHMGGVKIGDILTELAERCPIGARIVEVGPWLGGGTAHLALGAPRNCYVHLYDRFQCYAADAKKAAAFGIPLQQNDDTLPHVKKALAPFGANIIYHRVDLNTRMIKFNAPINLYIDDASKHHTAWNNVMSAFKHHFIPNETLLVLMDYYYYERAGNSYRTQYQYMTSGKYAHEFELVDDHVGATSTAIFRYLGGALTVPKGPRRRTICEVLRALADQARGRKDFATLELLAEAEYYAKRMDKKLRVYATQYGHPDYRPEMFGPKNIK